MEQNVYMFYQQVIRFYLSEYYYKIPVYRYIQQSEWIPYKVLLGFPFAWYSIKLDITYWEILYFF